MFSFTFSAGDSNRKYEWVLLQGPKSDDTGSVSDLRSQTITLMHLTQGVYIFKVEVTAEGAHGEAVGNVTVKPGEVTYLYPPEMFLNTFFFNLPCLSTPGTWKTKLCHMQFIVKCRFSLLFVLQVYMRWYRHRWKPSLNSLCPLCNHRTNSKNLLFHTHFRFHTLSLFLYL